MRTPIVLIHGIFGTVLKSDSRVVWPVKKVSQVMQLKDNVLSFLAGRTNQDTFRYESWTGNQYQADTQLQAVDKLVKSPLLNALGINLIDCFDLLIDKLIKMGYVKNSDLQAYTYDFLQLPSSDIQISMLVSFLKTFKTPPIIIAHSMGALQTKLLIQSKSDQINSLISGFIAIGAPFDGATGTTLLLPLIGYNLGAKLLDDSTRYLWGNSGMSLALMPGSEHEGVTQCIYATYDERIKDLDLEDFMLWKQVKIITDSNDIIMSILKQILRQPEKVQYRVSYWINRFKQFLKQKIQIPKLTNFKKESYVSKMSSASDFFKPEYDLDLESAKSNRLVQFTQLNRVQIIPEKTEINNFKNISQINDNSYKQSSYEAYINERPNGLEWIADETRSIIDFYNDIYPNKSIEQFVFGIVEPMFKFQQTFRRQNFKVDNKFKFYSICGSGIKTPQLVYFDSVKYISDLRFKQGKVVYGDGDGSVLLTSQLNNGLKNQGTIFPNVTHLNLIRNKECINDVTRVVDLWNK
ncbi:Lecithin-cholesterol acyltransferase [Spironucleus salmonicida]|uniref:Lecithin-cholesterol acyltransferase n=1 Tax=Spironucleus salmonicida TaxID=348837 RepID=V6LGG8_9EUKA|nr:Lecithin-cholesterol acyltransferase [Spironucleus salmonicida]|eukprot:EST43622.1 Lecithin:cholesterol acyltransferase family protein [Spironucleus salmonicida]